MIHPFLIAPDGACSLAALMAQDGPEASPSGPLSARLAAVIARAQSSENSATDPATTLAAMYTRRRQHRASEITGRAPATRFLRRQHRRWRVTQSFEFTDKYPIAALERAGRRAHRRGLGWADATALCVGVWLAFWAVEGVRDRRDLLAVLPLQDARRVARTPVEPEHARRFWR